MSAILKYLASWIRG